KLIQHFLIFLLLLALVLTNIEANPNAEEEEDETNINHSLNSLVNETEEQSSTLHGNGRSLLRKRWLRLTCNKFPRICRAKGSPGPSCCKKKCVNVLTDRLNCGRCGKKCRYNEPEPVVDPQRSKSGQLTSATLDSAIGVEEIDPLQDAYNLLDKLPQKVQHRPERYLCTAPFPF
ncbi:unnamed protein product, partial [Prunus brigantina]